MTTEPQAPAETNRDLVLTRFIPVPRQALWRCWTEPALLTQWFTPHPWTTVRAELDVRPGGSCLITMRSPEGEEFPNPGVYLEVIPNEKLVTTDAYLSAWQPSEKPFMTLILTLADEAGGTRYTALVRHWTAADREAHEKMGFDEGWGKATDQLQQLAATL
jgi:uncharacterized protein YndB with AHSA1/START domain